MIRVPADRERNTKSAACKLKSCEAYAPLTLVLFSFVLVLVFTQKPLAHQREGIVEGANGLRLGLGHRLITGHVPAGGVPG